ncbi:MAG TPA: NUDIX domain-containing protein [Capsulimonadaceae bacterium]|nr:NUDIX domain-containing protein [Capsulimonadaceae bacterium]
MMEQFPTAYWPEWDMDAAFLPGEHLPLESQGHLWAVLVHAYYGDQVVLADIVGRGVTIPSGRIEPGETIDEAVVREVYEETGGRLHETRRHLIGCHLTTKRSGPEAGVTKYSPVFVAEVVQFDPIPEGSESRGFVLLPPEAVADQYYMWDDLLAAEFTYALERKEELLPSGIGLKELTE